MTQAGVHRVVHRTCTHILLCSAFPRLDAAFPSDPLKLPLCPRWFPHCEGASLGAGISPHLQLPTKGVGPFTFPLLFFFHSIGCMGILLVLLGVQGLLLVFSSCSVRIVPSVDVFLMYCKERWILHPLIPPSWLPLS